MKKALLLILTSFCLYTASAQDFELVPYRLKDKWGFSDASQKIQIKPKFEDVIPFNYGYAAYKEKGKWGFINLEGEKIVSAKFDSISRYFQKFIVGYENDAAIYETGIQVYEKGKLQFINTQGLRFNSMPEIIEVVGFESDSEFIEVIEEGQLVGFINTMYETKSQVAYYDYTITEIGIIAKRKLKGLEYHVVLNLNTLQPIITGEYTSIKPTKNDSGFYITNKKGKMGYFDTKGEPLLDFKYNEIIKLTYSGFEFMVRPGQQLFGYIDLSKTPSKIIQPKYLHIGKFINGYAKVKTKNGQYGYIDYDKNEFFKK